MIYVNVLKAWDLKFSLHFFYATIILPQSNYGFVNKVSAIKVRWTLDGYKLIWNKGLDLWNYFKVRKTTKNTKYQLDKK